LHVGGVIIWQHILIQVGLGHIILERKIWNTKKMKDCCLMKMEVRKKLRKMRKKKKMKV